MKYIQTNAVRSFRRQLENAIRKGLYRLRVYGSKGEWFLGVERGDTIIQVRSDFASRTAAILAGVKRYGIKASRYEADRKQAA